MWGGHHLGRGSVFMFTPSSLTPSSLPDLPARLGHASTRRAHYVAAQRGAWSPPCAVIPPLPRPKLLRHPSIPYRGLRPSHCSARRLPRGPESNAAPLTPLHQAQQPLRAGVDAWLPCLFSLELDSRSAQAGPLWSLGARHSPPTPRPDGRGWTGGGGPAQGGQQPLPWPCGPVPPHTGRPGLQVAKCLPRRAWWLFPP